MIKILVVDDEKAFSGLVVRYFRDLGCQVDAVETAEAALPRIAAEPVDVCIVDNHLPGMSGIALTKRLRALQPNIYIVMVTIDRQDEIKAALTPEEADLFFKKPLLFDQFCDGVVGAIARLTRQRGETA